jgi:type III secretion protein V
MRLVLDSLMHWAQVNKDAGPVMIAECMRGSLKRQLCQNICDSDGVLGVAMLAPDLHDTIQGAISQSQKSGALGYLDGLPLDAELSEHLVSEMSRLQKSPNRIQESRQMAVVAPMGIRRRLRNFLAVNNINIPVLSAHELSADVRTVPIDLITAPQ